MQYKTHYKSSFSIIEVMAVLFIMFVFSGIVYVTLDPVERTRQARDSTRISDLQNLDTAIINFRDTNGRYPDTVSLPRVSNDETVAVTDLNRVTGEGWLKENLGQYLVKLPVDPINDAIYHYTYVHNNLTYELNARLEAQTALAANDGGNNSSTYELGDDLSLIL